MLSVLHTVFQQQQAQKKLLVPSVPHAPDPVTLGHWGSASSPAPRSFPAGTSPDPKHVAGAGPLPVP